MFRMVPNSLLGRFFERHGHDFDIDWERLGEREIDPIITSFSDLLPGEQDQIEGDLRNVFDLACESGIEAIIEAASTHGELSLAEAMPADAGYYARSMWAWLSHRKSFEKALLFHEVSHLRWWRKRNDVPRVEPDLSPEALDRLKIAISDLLMREQGRGNVCTVETMFRDETHYFIAHPDDFVQNVLAHDDDEVLTPRTFRRTFEIVFAFNGTEGTLELYAKVPARLKRTLEELFVNIILDDDLGPWNPDAVYELDHLKHHTVRLDTDPEDQLRVRIRRMRLTVQKTRRRIWIEVDANDFTDDIHHALMECLDGEHVPLTSVWVTQVTFCFEFLPLDGRKPGRMTFDVGYPDSCGLRNDRAERVELAQKYLKRWKIDRVRTDEPALAAVGD